MNPFGALCAELCYTALNTGTVTGGAELTDGACAALYEESARAEDEGLPTEEEGLPAAAQGHARGGPHDAERDAYAWVRLADELLWRRHRRSFLAWLRHAGQEIVRSAQEAAVLEIIYQI